jgi:hypothetical protein
VTAAGKTDRRLEKMKQLLEEIVRRTRGRDIGMKNLLVLIGLACTLGGRLKSAHFLWAILIGLPLPAQADALPFSDWKDDSHVSVVISPSVQQMIQQASPKESANIKRAIKVGNKFVRRRFNNDDQYDAEFDERWSKIVGPLMAMSGEEWGKIWAERWQTVSEVNIGGVRGDAMLLSCPQVSLVEIKPKPDGFSLIFQATLIGSYIELYSVHNSIDKTRAGKPYELRVEIGSRGKITDVTSSEKVMAFEYHDKKARLGIGIVSAQMAERYKQLIKDMDTAAFICNSTETNH